MIIDNDMGSLDKLSEEKYLILDFYAEWCRPCSNFSDVLQSVSAQFPDLNIIKIDVDRYPELADQYSVSSIPNLVFFKQGVIWDQVVGLLSESVLSSKIRGLMFE